MNTLLFLEAEDLVGETIGDWKCEIEGMSGCLLWSNPKSELVIYGTPNWEDTMGQTPFEYTDKDGDYQRAMVLNYVDMKGDVEAQKLYYLKTLSFILPNLVW